MARILIIEDDASNLEIAQVLLEHSGHRVSVATDGRAGLIAARRERPDLIICDLHAPALEGFGMLEQLKLDAACGQTPIVAVMTAEVRQSERAASMSGFDAYLSMPIPPETFVAQIESLLPATPGE